MKNYIYKITVALLVISAFFACSEPDSRFDGYNGGKPEIRYIRPCDIAVSDSLLTSAFLGNEIAVIGNNLAGVNAIYFNDQKAKLNPQFVTNNSIIVTIPNGIPTVKQDIIKFCTLKDTVIYTFETKVPAPAINSMDCEYVEDGGTAVIHGLYFVDDGSSPLEVYFSDGVRANIISSDLNSITVEVPVGAVPGPITVTSVYGTAESSLWFRDNRNIILDFDTTFPDGGYNHGWHGGSGYGTADGVDGQYLIFTGTMSDDTWDDSHFGYERWTYREDDPDFVDAGALDKYVMKFEVNVQGWSAAALQFIFTGAEEVWMNWQDTSNGGNPNNSYVSDAAYPRALWMPWTTSGSFSTENWITVTIPMTEFKYNNEGTAVAAKAAGHYSGITLFVQGGGVKGTECTPTFHIDNVRVVKK